MYVYRVQLSNVRAIADSELNLLTPSGNNSDFNELPNINVLVGANGSGKSTVLKAIAASVVGTRRRDFTALVGGWPRIGGPSTARVDIGLTARTERGRRYLDRTLYIEGGDVSVGGAARAVFSSGVFAAYGPQRVASTRASPIAWTRPQLLYRNATVSAFPTRRPNTPHLVKMVELANRVLPDDVVCRESPDADGNWFEQRGVSVAIDQLSDGVQGFLAWFGDLLNRLGELATEDLRSVVGVVLVDEIDQQMHPLWQRTVLPRLSAALPNLQFICTSHSPLLISSLRIRNLHLVEPDPEAGQGATVVRQFEAEDVYGLTADQVLRSSYFGLESSRAPALVNELRRLAASAEPGDAGAEAALRFMRRLAEADRQTLRDQ